VKKSEKITRVHFGYGSGSRICIKTMPIHNTVL
jgi:hypothetical protein